MSKANFHHIHFNVKDEQEAIHYYKKFFGANSLTYRNKKDVLYTERSFLFFDKVEYNPNSHVGSSLWHIGWSGVDGQSEFDWRVAQGIEVETPINPLGDSHWMYFYGPNREIVEVFTGNKTHNFEHIHLLATDVDDTMAWFEKYLGLKPESKKAEIWPNGLFKWNKIFTNNINIMVNGKPNQQRTWFPSSGFKSTKGTAIDHIAFSFEDIQSVYDKMKLDNLEIMESIKVDPLYGLRSFYVTGPDKLLIEIVEEKPIPEGIWL